MLKRRVIACLDVRAGRVVKGVKFSGLRDAGDPADLAGYYAQQGADEIVVLDVGATPDNRATAYETVRAVRERIDVPLTVGGGVRCVEDAERLLLAGADRVAVNTAAVRRPELLRELALRFGTQCIVLAIDAQRDGSDWRIVVESGRQQESRSAIDWAAAAAQAGVGEILLTSWDRDGTRQGYDLALITAVRAAVSVPIIASGGANDASHLIDALRAGADAVLVASILHDGDCAVGDLKRALEDSGVEVRVC